MLSTALGLFLLKSLAVTAFLLCVGLSSETGITSLELVAACEA
jgi:hypothetical protein